MVAKLYGYQSERRSHDTVRVAVGIIFYYPAFYYIKGNSPLTGELARLKGEAFAVREAAINKNCGFEFRAY